MHGLGDITAHGLHKMVLNVATTDRLNVNMHHNSVASMSLAAVGWLEA